MTDSRTMWNARMVSAAMACLLWTLGCSVSTDDSSEPSPAPAADLVALAAFDVVYEVLMDPRCMNCHPDGDRPLQFDDATPHIMNVQRGEDDRGRPGMRCVTCHGRSNPDLVGLPPGVDADWHLAPREMVFEGQSKHDLARMLLDPARSHMTTDELIEHVSHDALVLWGWDPGPGRRPVAVPHADFVEAFKTWIAAGAPVPPEDNE